MKYNNFGKGILLQVSWQELQCLKRGQELLAIEEHRRASENGHETNHLPADLRDELDMIFNRRAVTSERNN